MRTVRIIGALLSLLVIADFSFRMWLDTGPTRAMVPALAGAFVMTLMSLRDAASSRSRKLLFCSTIFLALGLATSLAALISSHLPRQIALAVIMLTAAVLLAFRAFHDSRRRRQSAIGYYLTGYGAN